MVKGITIGKDVHKVKAFADDVIVTVEEPLESIPRAIEKIKEFGELAGFDINMKKTNL